jgi:hypothetical protein
MTDTVRLTCGAAKNLLGSGVTVASSSGTAAIVLNIMTVTVASTGYFSAGNVISGTLIPPNTYIEYQVLPLIAGEALGGVGRYLLNQNAPFASGAVTADGSGLWTYKDGVYASVQSCVDGTAGVQTATVIFDVSNDALHPVGTSLGTTTLSGTLTASDGFTTAAAWKFIRARVTAVSGTGALVTALLGV